MALEYAQENIWYDKWRYDEAECQYYEKQFGGSTSLTTLASQIAKAREEIQSSLSSSNRLGSATSVCITSDIFNMVTKLEGENKNLQSAVSSLEKSIAELTKRIATLETSAPKHSVANVVSAAEQKNTKEDEDEDDDVDLFGSDDEEEDEAAARLREQRLKDYAEKKAKKPSPIAKSSILLDCKPWDDETDMQQMENAVRKIEMDGLTWGAAKLVPLAFGIKKLSILCTVEDEKVSVDDLIEKITEHEDYVQSVDIAAFNKI